MVKVATMSHVLYYPTIEFQSIETLKRALLVWDRVFRIVPSLYHPRDSVEVNEAKGADRVIDFAVDDSEKSRAAKGFLDFYAVRRKHRRLTWPAGLDSESFVRINPEKIDAKLLPLFEQLASRLNKEGFLEIPPDLAGGYMFFLANAIAKRRSLGLLTDSADCWTVGSYFAQEGNFSEQVYDEKAGAYLCNLAVEKLLPDHLDHIGMDQLLRFCEKHTGERTAFQDHLNKLRSEIARCNSKQHAKYIVGDFVNRFDRAREDYRKEICAFSKREICSIFSVGLPTSISILSLAPAASDPYDALRLGTALLIGAVSALAARNLIPRNKGVPSYLVSLEELGRTPHYPLHRKFEEFVND
jgi:hypothetical protein